MYASAELYHLSQPVGYAYLCKIAQKQKFGHFCNTGDVRSIPGGVFKKNYKTEQHEL